VGRVLDTLQELKVAENTLVMFSSDNGPWLVKGKDGGEAGPLRGGKGSTWEGGVREPTIAWWPGKVAPGSVCDAVAGNIDFLPTFVGLAGGAVPTDNKIDGKDIAPLLFGATKESPHEARYYYSGYRLQAVRVGPWKMSVAPQTDSMGIATTPVPATLEKPRLYNLDTDIGERTDVAADHPEIIARLKPLALQMAADLGDGKPGPGVREPGRVKNPVTLYPVDETSKKPAPGNGAPTAGTTGKGVGTDALLENLKIGDAFSGDHAPHVQGRALTIQCEVETKGADGVIVAHGGSAVGYALYLKQGHATFVVHQGGREITRISSPAALGAKVQIEARLAVDGAMTLSIDGQSIATGKTDGPLNRQPAEAFCVGHDDGRPVDDGYDGKKMYEGAIRGLKVSTAPGR
jgi:hypothetical protein